MNILYIFKYSSSMAQLYQINTEKWTPKPCYPVIKTTVWWLNWLRIVSTFSSFTEIPCSTEVIWAEMFIRNIIQKMAWTQLPCFTSWPILVVGAIYSKRQSHGSRHIQSNESHTHAHTHFFPWDCCCAQLSF